MMVMLDIYRFCQLALPQGYNTLGHTSNPASSIEMMNFNLNHSIDDIFIALPTKRQYI